MSIAFIRGYNNRYSLSDLWGQAFGDDPEFISDMYEAGYLKAEDVFALTEEGRLVSAVFLPEYLINVGGETKKIRLLSCVATNPSQRNKGFMSQMLPRVLQIASEQCDAVCVIPVSEDLYSFYEKFGFTPGFYVSESCFDAETQGNVLNLNLNVENPQTFYTAYRAKYSAEGCVFKSEERFLQAVKEYTHSTQPCEFCQIGTGFAFIQRGAAEITVREFAGIPPEDAGRTLSAKYGLPVRIQDLPGSSDNHLIAMIFTKDEVLLSLAKDEKLYLNCMYN